MKRALLVAFLAACASPAAKPIAARPSRGILFAQDDDRVYWATWDLRETEVWSQPKAGGEATLLLHAPGKGNGLAVLSDEIALTRVTDVRVVTSKGRTVVMPGYLDGAVGAGRDLFVAIDTGYEHQDEEDGGVAWRPSVFRIDGTTPREISDPLSLGEMVVAGDDIFATQCLVAIDAAYDGGIVRVPRGGGEARTVASHEVKWDRDGTICPAHLAVDDTDVWFTLGDEVKRVSRVGGPVTTWSNAKGAAGVAVDGDRVFVAARDEHAIVSFSKSTRARAVVKGGLDSPVFVAVDATSVRWLEEKDARRGSTPR